jgi:hypothetical protein
MLFGSSLLAGKRNCVSYGTHIVQLSAVWNFFVPTNHGCPISGAHSASDMGNRGP